MALLLAAGTLLAADSPQPGDSVATSDGPLVIRPINHASLALLWKQKTILVDPVGSLRLYTMEVPQAAQAVRAFRPKVVYPYHCRGSNLEEFKKLVGADPAIEVRLRNWY